MSSIRNRRIVAICCLTLTLSAAQALAQQTDEGAIPATKPEQESSSNLPGALADGVASQPEALLRSQIETMVNTWRISCDPKQNPYTHNVAPDQVNAFFRQMALSGMTDGMLRINAINPNLAKDVVERMKKKKISVTCEKDLGGGGGTNKYLFTGKIRIASVLLEVYMQTQALIGQGLPLANSAEGSRVFHEFLHVAGLDNLPLKIHNSHTADVRSDVVYACSDTLTSNEMDSCIVCAIAKRELGQTYLDLSQFDSARHACATYLSQKSGKSVVKPPTITPENISPSVVLTQK